MKVFNENLVVDKVTYRTKCSFCGTKVEVDGKDLCVGPFPMTRTWICPICQIEVVDFAPKFRTNKVVYYKTNKIDKE